MGEAIGSAADATGQDANAVYALGSSQGESARLQRQAEDLAADSAALLDRVGLCYPPHQAFDRICEIYPVALGRNGADPRLGRRVPELFRQAGLGNVEVEARPQMYPPGSSRRANRLDLVRSMRSQIVQMELASEAELDELDAAARVHLNDPHTIVMSGLLFLTWGRKPDHARGDLLSAS
jgi:hypothetical protein